MKIYFIGIGGAALSALAFMYKKLGHDVIGHDAVENPIIDSLKKAGVTVYIHPTDEVITPDIDLVVATAAYVPGSPSWYLSDKINKLGLKVVRREYLIDHISKEHEISIGICGTHGKTTTTSLLVHCLEAMNQRPSYLVGGIIHSLGKNADVGNKKYFVWEADEYSNAFHGVHLTHAIVNNIEWDHPDFFPTISDYIDSFVYFTKNNVSKLVASNYDDENVQKITSNPSLNNNGNKTFGKSKDADYYFSDINFGADNTQFGINHNGEHYFVVTQLHGMHNVYNITAVFAMLHELGFAANDIIAAIASFVGAGRRFEKIFEDNNKIIISDYAHHPTAVKTTIEGAKALGLQVVAIFEPHQYLRLKTLYTEFIESFDKADQVIILPIYTARETDVPAYFSEQFAKDIGSKASYNSSFEDLANQLHNYKGEKKLFLCMSAGNLDGIIRKEFLPK